MGWEPSQEQFNASQWPALHEIHAQTLSRWLHVTQSVVYTFYRTNIDIALTLYFFFCCFLLPNYYFCCLLLPCVANKDFHEPIDHTGTNIGLAKERSSLTTSVCLIIVIDSRRRHYYAMELIKNSSSESEKLIEPRRRRCHRCTNLGRDG